MCSMSCLLSFQTSNSDLTLSCLTIQCSFVLLHHFTMVELFVNLMFSNTPVLLALLDQPENIKGKQSQLFVYSCTSICRVASYM